MKAKRFLKRVGIISVPILATLLPMLVFNGVCEWAFNAAHPDDLSQLFFTVGKQAVSHVMVSFVIALWIFASLMNWAKGKFLKMEAAENKEQDADAGKGNGGNPDENHQAADQASSRGIRVCFTSIAYSITTNIQKWLAVTRYLSCVISDDTVVGNVHLDIPNDEERKENDFWQKCDAFIYALWVHDAYRKRGIATRLLETAERNAKQQGCKTIALEWNAKEAEEWTLRWYLSRGYVEKAFGKDTSFLVKTLAWNDIGETEENDLHELDSVDE